MRFFASLLAVVCFAAVAHTQTLTKNPEATGAVTPEDMTKRLEQTEGEFRYLLQGRGVVCNVCYFVQLALAR